MSILREAVTAYSVASRHRKARWIAQRSADANTSLFVGCRPSLLRNVNIIENDVAGRTRVLASVDVDAGHGSSAPWPHVIADGRHLPFADDAVDLVLANAVIEHVGGEADQKQFVAEQTRVGTSWVITTPNRWFPVEAHTATLFKHWSPGWRDHRDEFTRLLSRREFIDLLPESAVIRGSWWSATFTAYYRRGLTPPPRPANQVATRNG